MRRKLFVVAVVALAAGFALAAGESYDPVRAAGFPDGVYAEILPETELLSGVLSQTSWIRTRGPRGAGNTYFRELRAFFAPFKGHEAVVLAEKLTRIGFTYDAPPCTGADGRSGIYQFIREEGASQAEPEFPSGPSLESLALHEWGHSFVNPALAKHAASVRQLEPLFRPVRKVMRQQAYGNVETFRTNRCCAPRQPWPAATSTAPRRAPGIWLLTRSGAFT